jgi:hypothetical protein
MYTSKFYFVEGATQVGDIFWPHPAKPTRRGCTAFDRFWQRVAGQTEAINKRRFFYFILFLFFKN